MFVTAFFSNDIIIFGHVFAAVLPLRSCNKPAFVINFFKDPKTEVKLFKYTKGKFLHAKTQYYRNTTQFYMLKHKDT